MHPAVGRSKRRAERLTARAILSATERDAVPAIRRKNDHVVDETRPSTTTPGLTVSGARALTPGERLLRGGRITLAQGEAAREYVALVSLVEGSRSGRWIGESTGGGGGNAGGGGTAVSQAIEKLSRADEYLGPHGRPFLTAVLYHERDLVASYLAHLARLGMPAVTRSVADQRAVGHLASLLEVLVWRWRIVPRYGRRPPAPEA